jgi:tetratricopeptide (TPR) repeat protein
MRLARSSWAGIAFLAAVFAGPPAAAQQQLHAEQCVNKGGAFSRDAQLEACAAVINSGRSSGKNLAWAYNSRGNAYYVKREYDRAIAEYNKGIRLDPKNAFAYHNRGLS